MKPTEQEIKAFENLNKSDSGKILVAYCKRVVDYVYDSRSWSDGDTKESAAHAARVIQKYLVDRISLLNQPKQVEKNPFD